MSVHHRSAAWRYGDKSNPRDFLALLALCDWANDEGICWPGIATLAERIGVEEKQARRITKKLIDQGYVTIIKKGGGKLADGRGIPNLFQITIPPEKLTPPAREGSSELTSPQKGGNPPLKDSIDINPVDSLKDSLKDSKIKNKNKESLKVDRQIKPALKKNDVRKVAEERFTHRTNLEPTYLAKKEAGALWWNPLREICQLVEWRPDDVVLLIDYAIDRAKELDCQISSPKSIIKFARAIVGEAKKGSFQKGGGPKGSTGVDNWRK